MQPYCEIKQPVQDGISNPIDCFENGSEFPRPMIQPHFHNEIEIIYVQYGSIQIFLNSQCRTLTAGSLAIAGTGQVHATSINTAMETRCTVIKFAPDLYLHNFIDLADISFSADQLITLSISYTRAQLAGSGIPAIIATILSEYKRQESGCIIAIQAEIWKIYLWVLRNRSVSQQEPYWVQHVTPIQQILHYTEEHYFQELSPTEIAQQFHMSYSCFSRLFRQVTGMTFKTYLNRVRIREAEKLLLTSEFSVTEIALRCGYSNTSYFIRQFRLYKELSPRQFLKQLRCL